MQLVSVRQYWRSMNPVNCFNWFTCGFEYYHVDQATMLALIHHLIKLSIGYSLIDFFSILLFVVVSKAKNFLVLIILIKE